MFETKIENTTIKLKDKLIYNNQRLGYEVVSAVQAGLNVTITFRRDLELNNIDQVKEIEKKINLVIKKMGQKLNNAKKEIDSRTKSELKLIIGSMFLLFVVIIMYVATGYGVLTLIFGDEFKSNLIYTLSCAAVTGLLTWWYVSLKKKIKKKEEDVECSFDKEAAMLEQLYAEAEKLIFED